MKVAFNARYLYDPNLRGFNRYSSCLLRALARVPEVDLYLLSEARYPVHEAYRSALRAEVTHLAARRTLVWEQWVLPRYLKKLRPDVFHAPADGGLPLRRECPYVLTCHGVPDLSLSFLLGSGALLGDLSDYMETATGNGSRVGGVLGDIRGRLFRWAYLQTADLVITVSEFSKRELTQFLGLSPAKIRVIPEGADEPFVEPLPPEFVDQVRVAKGIPPRFVLFVGGFDKRKNLSTLLAAFAAVRRVEPDVALVLVGIGGDVQACKRRSAELGLSEGRDVFVLTGLPDLELAALYRATSLFATLSWHEGFCLPIVEAMTCGAPILASSFGAIPEVLGDAGRLVDPRDAAHIVEGMLSILCQPGVRDEMGSRSLLRSELFSWERTARMTLDAYREVASQ